MKMHYYWEKLHDLLPRKIQRKLTNRFYVGCIKCGAQTSLYKTRLEAVEAWNMRAREEE